MDTHRPLPIRLELVDGQGLDCYLEHVSTANHIPAGTFMRHLDASTDTTRYLLLSPTARTADVLTRLTGATPQALRAATVAAYDGLAVNLVGLDPTRQSSYRTVAARGWVPGRGTQACPRCLTETGRWDIGWRLPATTVCLRHQAYLVAECPGCRRPFRDRTRPLRPVGPVTRCGNALGARGRYCQVDVAALEPTLADPDCLDRQDLQQQAIDQDQASIMGRSASSLTWHEDVRSLTALLLHIATAAPDRTDLPQWAKQASAREGSEGRAPRWALAPPPDVATRSRAMTQAHNVLGAPNLETAVSRFVAWADLVPETPDGFLGWVGDHTRATPNVTRLVMATHAPRRRISRLLDASPDLTRGLDGVPPTVPGSLYLRYLADLFTSRPAEVRTFAALCLTRTHPDIQTWAEAISALDLEPSAGARVVQSCTAGMTASPQEVITMLGGVAEELLGDRSRVAESRSARGMPSVSKPSGATRQSGEGAEAVIEHAWGRSLG